MEEKVINYPEMKARSFLSKYLSPSAILIFRNFVDHIRQKHKESDLELLYNTDTFALIVSCSIHHEPLSARVAIWDSSFFEPATSEKNIHLDDEYNQLIKHCISHIQYLNFFVKNMDRIFFYANTGNFDYSNLLPELRFTESGYIDNYFLKSLDPLFAQKIFKADGRNLDDISHDSHNNEEYADKALIYSMTREKFLKMSSAVVKIKDFYLKLQSTEFALISFENIPYDGLDEFLKDFPGELEEKKARLEENEVLYRGEPYNGLKHAVSQIFDGQVKDMNLIYDVSHGTDFQKRVWQETSKIPYGETVSYDDIARKLAAEKRGEEGRGLPTRAVGTALGRNPVIIAIPCHRVIGKDGKLRGFTGGLDMKDFLLSLELENYNK